MNFFDILFWIVIVIYIVGWPLVYWGNSGTNDQPTRVWGFFLASFWPLTLVQYM